MKKKTIALLMAVVMLFGVAVGGTIAWLTATSEDVVNTFVVGNIQIKLDEAPVDENGKATSSSRVQGNTYDLIPGSEYDKDPKVTVIADSESCYVFVKVIEENNSVPTIEFNIDTTNWIYAGTDTAGNKIYRYKDVVPNNKTENFVTPSVILNSKITIDDDLTAQTMNPTSGTYAVPKLTFKACAVQSANLTPESAYGQVVFN